MIAQHDLQNTWTLAREYIIAKNYPSAEKILSTLHSSVSHIELTLDYISVLLKLKKHSMAHELLEHSLLQYPKESRLQALKASLLYTQGKYQDALALYKTLLSSSPNNPAYWTNAAYCAALLGQFSEACAFFAKSEPLLQVFPHNWLRNYAIALLMTKQPAQAYAYFLKLQSQSSTPLDSEELFHFALSADLIGESSQAQSLYKDAIAANPQAIPPLYNLSIHYQRSGQTALAQSLWETILQLDPKHTLAKTLLEASIGSDLPHLPLPFVEALFDQYSFNYDQHLKSVLQYQAPATARSLLMKHYPSLKPGVLVDLGAGTGVMGRVMRDLATHMTAVDCSEGMLLQAKMTQMYDSYIKADLISWAKETSHKADLFTLIEVSNYVGPALEGVLQSLWALLLPGGVIALTAEESGVKGSPVHLQPCARFAFNEEFFTNIAKTLPSSSLVIDRAPIRKDGESDVKGLYVFFSKPGSPPENS